MTRRAPLGHMQRLRIDAPPLALLLRRARAELGLTSERMARAFRVSQRTLGRWEQGDARPTYARENVAIALGKIDGETWRAIVGAMRLPLDATLEKVPAQKAKLERHVVLRAPAGAAARTPAQRSMDAVVRELAEDLDVSARRLRVALASFMDAAEAAGLSLAKARELVTVQARARDTARLREK